MTTFNGLNGNSIIIKQIGRSIKNIREYLDICEEQNEINESTILLILLELLLRNTANEILDHLETYRMDATEIIKLLASEINKLKAQSEYAKTFISNC